MRVEVGSEMQGAGGERACSGEVSTTCRAKRSATEAMLKVVAGPDGGGSVRDSGEGGPWSR